MAQACHPGSHNARADWHCLTRWDMEFLVWARGSVKIIKKVAQERERESWVCLALALVMHIQI